MSRFGSSQRIGGHGTTAGGLGRAPLRYADEVGAECIQLYISNPRGWALTPGDPAQDEAFVAGCRERDLTLYIHATLLVNLGSPTELTVERSVAALQHAWTRGRALGAAGVVFHAGSAVGEDRYEVALRQVREALLPLLDTAADGPRFLVEPSAGGGRSLAAMVADLGPYLDAVDGHPGLGVCLDTCHAWAAGHDLALPGEADAMLDELERVAPGRLALIHANDSLDLCGSKRDRHTNIGAGQIGEKAFAEILAHPTAKGVPVIVETPIEDNGHRRDIELLRSLRDPR